MWQSVHGRDVLPHLEPLTPTAGRRAGPNPHLLQQLEEQTCMGSTIELTLDVKIASELPKSMSPGEPSLPLLDSDSDEGDIPSFPVPFILWQARSWLRRLME